MAIYQGRRKGTYRVKVWAGNVPHERIVEGTKADAKKFEAKLRLELQVACSRSVARCVPTFERLCEDTYLPHAEKVLRASTYRVRYYCVETLVALLGKIRIDRFKAEDLSEYKRSRQVHLRPSSLNGELRVFRTIARWARDEMGLPFALPSFKMIAKSAKGRVRCWTLADVRRLYASASIVSPRMIPLIHFLLDTGCRKGEAMAAEWSWVDFDARMLRIPVTEHWQPKDKEAREIPLSDALMGTLRSIEKGDRHIFVRQDKSPYLSFPNAIWARIVSGAGLVGGPHTTRHTFASHFLQTTPDLWKLATILGHSSTTVTSVYTHLLPGHLDGARNAVQLAPPTEPWREPVASDSDQWQTAETKALSGRRGHRS